MKSLLVIFLIFYFQSVSTQQEEEETVVRKVVIPGNVPIPYLASISPMFGVRQPLIESAPTMRRDHIPDCDDPMRRQIIDENVLKSDLSQIYHLIEDIISNITVVIDHEVEDEIRSELHNENEPLEDIITCGGQICPDQTESCKIIEESDIDSMNKKKLQTIMCLSKHDEILKRKSNWIGNPKRRSERKLKKIKKEVHELGRKIEKVMGYSQI